MTRSYYSLLLIFLVALTLPATSVPVNAAPADKPLFAPGELIVKFRSGLEAGVASRLASANNLRLVRQLRKIGAGQYRLPSGVNAVQVAEALRRMPEVLYAEPNYYRYINLIPNDPLFNLQYGLDNQGQTGGTVDADIDAPEAWDIATGSRDVVVAVIDSGIDLNHPDLVANLATNAGEIPNNGLDDDGNGFVDDVVGWDFVDDDNDPTDSSPACVSHGIHTAGTVGAVGNNATGVSGVAHAVSILPLRAFRAIFAFCGATDADLIAAIEYAESRRVDISNNSWGGGPFSQAMFNAIAGARHLFVAAAGNEGRNNDTFPHYPDTYPLDHIMSVAASNHNDQLAGFSNFGVQNVDLAAPGVGIWSTVGNGGYGSLSGTSMATPHVAGAAAVLLGAEPGLTPHELKFRLRRGVDPRSLPVNTGGRLNLFNTLTLDPPRVTIELGTSGPTQISGGDPISIDVRLENQTAQPQTFDIWFRIWTPFGETTPTPRLSLTMPPGLLFERTFFGAFPAGIPAGSYRFIGSIEGASSAYFDEGQVIYEIN